MWSEFSKQSIGDIHIAVIFLWRRTLDEKLRCWDYVMLLSSRLLVVEYNESDKLS